jgi:drug/metabolite transporter (DMT)-like permease
LLADETPPPAQHAFVGYAMVLAAATLWAVNGAVSKIILEQDVSSQRLAQLRSTGAFVGLALAVVLVAPRTLRLSRRELPILVLFGVGGLACVQWFYFVAIHRLEIGVALLIQYLAPLLVALWARYVMKRRVRRRIWVALAFAVTGLAFVLDIGGETSLSTIGITASLLCACSYALYVLLAEREVGARDPISLTTFGFLFAALFWALLQPWWSFPFDAFVETRSAAWGLPVWALGVWMILLGTIVPFGLLVASLRFVSATRAGITAMFEPVAATVVAWLWLGEELGTGQLGGGALVLAGILLAQSAR